MVNFELGKELEKYVYSSCHESETKKNEVPMTNRTSDLRILRSDAPTLSHKNSMVNVFYYEVQMTRVLHSVRISNVDSVIFLNRFTNMTLCPLMGTRNFLFVLRS